MCAGEACPPRRRSTAALIWPAGVPGPSGLLFGTSSEKRAPAARGGGAGEDGAGGRSHGARRRGQRPGAPGHGRRSYAHLETEERVIDLEPEERCCPRCGTGYEFIGTEDSELIDWQVKLIRILQRRR